jgi:hypothetical protein
MLPELIGAIGRCSSGRAGCLHTAMAAGGCPVARVTVFRRIRLNRTRPVAFLRWLSSRHTKMFLASTTIWCIVSMASLRK